MSSGLLAVSGCCRCLQCQVFFPKFSIVFLPVGNEAMNWNDPSIPWEHLLSSDFLKAPLTAKHRSPPPEKHAPIILTSLLHSNYDPNLIRASSTSCFSSSASSSSIPSACLFSFRGADVFLTVKRKEHGSPRTGKCQEQRVGGAREARGGGGKRSHISSGWEGAIVEDEEEWLEALVFKAAGTFWIPLATWP